MMHFWYANEVFKRKAAQSRAQAVYLSNLFFKLAVAGHHWQALLLFLYCTWPIAM